MTSQRMMEASWRKHVLTSWDQSLPNSLSTPVACNPTHAAIPPHLAVGLLGTCLWDSCRFSPDIVLGMPRSSTGMGDTAVAPENPARASLPFSLANSLHGSSSHFAEERIF